MGAPRIVTTTEFRFLNDHEGQNTTIEQVTKNLYHDSAGRRQYMKDTETSVELTTLTRKQMAKLLEAVAHEITYFYAYAEEDQ